MTPKDKVCHHHTARKKHDMEISILCGLYYLLLFFHVHPVAGEGDPNYGYSITTNRLKPYLFVLSEGPVQPDNYKQSGYLINGQFPGPPIFAHQYDLLRVTVINEMSVPTSIHFHGILQEHTLAADGVAYVTQDPIYPGQNYTYDVQLGSQTGTFMYHGHMDFDIVFIHGALIVLDNPTIWNALGVDYKYDYLHEKYFLLEEIFHYPVHQFFLDITVGNGRRPSVMSLPINGLSYGDWPAGNGNAPGYEVWPVVRGRTYRIRVINVATDSFLRFSIQGHRMKVIEMDGILTFPVWTDHLEINAGQRYSVLVTMDREPKNYWIQSVSLGGRGGPPNGRTILHYPGAPDPNSLRKQVFLGSAPGVNYTSWILPQLWPNPMLAQTEVYELPKKANQRITVDWYMKKIDGRSGFLINGHQYVEPNTTYLTQVRAGIDISKNSHQVFPVVAGNTVDIIFQNRVIENGPCIQHPIHLHGHSFYLLAEGPDGVDPNKLESIIGANVAGGRLQFRDVFTIFPFQTVENTTSSAPCGWAVIRFIANNPGIWLGHCHITTHMILGKKFVIYEYEPENKALVNE